MTLRIKEILDSKSITQKELSEKLGLTTVGLNKMINGNPTVETLTKIAHALDINVKDLFVNDLNGFVDYKGTIYRIENKEDLQNILEVLN